MDRLWYPVVLECAWHYDFVDKKYDF
jgi:hypothetical protein